MHCVSTQACVGIKKHVKLYMPREVVEGSNFDMKVRDEGYAQVTRSAVLDQFSGVYEFDDKMSEPDSTAGYIDAGRKIYKAVYDDVIAQHDLAIFLVVVSRIIFGTSGLSGFSARDGQAVWHVFWEDAIVDYGEQGF